MRLQMIKKDSETDVKMLHRVKGEGGCQL